MVATVVDTGGKYDHQVPQKTDTCMGTCTKTHNL